MTRAGTQARRYRTKVLIRHGQADTQVRRYGIKASALHRRVDFVAVDRLSP